MPANDHSLLSSYREMLLEHLFAGEVMRLVWHWGNFDAQRGQAVDAVELDANDVRNVHNNDCLLQCRFAGGLFANQTLNDK